MPMLAPMTIWWPLTSNGAQISSIIRSERAVEIAGLMGPGLYDCELVAAEASDGFGRSQAAQAVVCDQTEECVSNGMAERVVDGLEVIKVKAQTASAPRIRRG